MHVAVMLLALTCPSQGGGAHKCSWCPLQVRAFSFAKGGLVAAAGTHRHLLQVVLHLPASFFDATPSGRVLNRFSSDTGGLP